MPNMWDFLCKKYVFFFTNFSGGTLLIKCFKFIIKIFFHFNAKIIKQIRWIQQNYTEMIFLHLLRKPHTTYYTFVCVYASGGGAQRTNTSCGLRRFMYEINSRCMCLSVVVVRPRMCFGCEWYSRARARLRSTTSTRLPFSVYSRKLSSAHVTIQKTQPSALSLLFWTQFFFSGRRRYHHTRFFSQKGFKKIVSPFPLPSCACAISFRFGR